MKNILKTNGMTLGGKLIVFQAAAIIVLLLVLALIAGQLIKNRFSDKSTEEMAGLNKRIIEMIDVYNIKLKEHAESLADVLIKYNAGKRDEHISLQNIDRFTSITGAVATLFVRKGDDFMRESTSLRKQDGTRAVGTLLDRNHPGYKRVLAGSSYTGPAVLFGRNYMTHYEPIKKGDKVTGIHFIGLDFTAGIKNLKQKIRAIKIADSGNVFIIEGPKYDNNGKCVVHVSDGIEEKDLAGIKDKKGNEFIKTILRENNGIIEYEWDHDPEKNTELKYAAFNYYDEWNWIIISSAPEKELIADGIILRNLLFAGFFLCSIIILAVLYFAVRKIITRRFNDLNHIVKNLSKGEGDLTVRLDFTGKDEIGTLAGNFNNFLDTLEKMIRDITTAGRNLAKEVEKISEGNQDLSQRTVEQASSLEEIASTLEESFASLSINVDNAQKAKEITGEGASRAEKGNKIAGEAVEAINEINSSSKKIMQMLTSIHEITFQTNLLALNAAIEAARAGDHGRGFAVVAGEVRNLAQRSSRTAIDIETIIKDSISKIERGTTMVTKTGLVLGEISESARLAADLMAEMSVASLQQRQSTSQINDAVTTLDAMTQQNSELVEKTASAAGEMAMRARKLSEMLHRFKIREGEIS